MSAQTETTRGFNIGLIERKVTRRGGIPTTNEPGVTLSVKDVKWSFLFGLVNSVTSETRASNGLMPTKDVDVHVLGMPVVRRHIWLQS